MMGNIGPAAGGGGLGKEGNKNKCMMGSDKEKKTRKRDKEKISKI
jgi:hypothetical protein